MKQLFEKKSWWKIFLAIFGSLITVGSLIYTKNIVDVLSQDEKARAQNILKAVNAINSATGQNDYSLPLHILQSNKSIPVILVSNTGQITDGINFGEQNDLDTSYLRKRLNILIETGAEPIIDDGGQMIYYESSIFIDYLSYFPLIQIFLIATFIAIGYVAFSSIRKAEQNRVWVGMAKETAHQLGTPISGILGWVEHLKFIRSEDNEVKEIADEIANDLTKLDLIADRFSKIGSEPELTTQELGPILERNFSYIEKRAPRKVRFEIEEQDHSAHLAKVNVHLIDWVLENLLRNALDSIGKEGLISGSIQADSKWIHIDISDNGKGIPSNKFKTIFKPGYSTKKRGWGLGLSLAKRIIDNYHNGKIFVKESTENVKTTFRISIPLVKKVHVS
jgi:signal transduction histidine kinase